MEQNVNLKSKTIKVLEENTRLKKILTVEKAFLNIMQNSKAIKNKIDKLKYL